MQGTTYIYDLADFFRIVAQYIVRRQAPKAGFQNTVASFNNISGWNVMFIKLILSVAGWIWVRR